MLGVSDQPGLSGERFRWIEADLLQLAAVAQISQTASWLNAIICAAGVQHAASPSLKALDDAGFSCRSCRSAADRRFQVHQHWCDELHRAASPPPNICCPLGTAASAMRAGRSGRSSGSATRAGPCPTTRGACGGCSTRPSRRWCISGRKVVTVQINGCDIRIIHATTGELIRELTLNPAVDYQARGARKPRPKPS
jgi:hypothetical protein